MAQKNERALFYAGKWVVWLSTRRFFGPPAVRDVLTRLAKKSGCTREPDGPMSDEIAAFHCGVVALPAGSLLPFIKIYCEFPEEPVKKLAYDMGIGRAAYYDRAHAAAQEVLRLQSIVLNMQLLEIKQSGFNQTK